MSQYKGYEAKVETIFYSPSNAGIKFNTSGNANIT